MTTLAMTTVGSTTSIIITLGTTMPDTIMQATIMPRTSPRPENPRPWASTLTMLMPAALTNARQLS